MVTTRRASARSRRRRPTRLAAVGAGLGAAAMYFLDPVRGRRRRGVARSKVYHYAHEAPGTAEMTARDLRNRTKGLLARGSRPFRPDEASDAVVVERVRAELGRVIRHPRSIDVQVRDGRVTLQGLILRDEAVRLQRTVASVRGVREIDNQLEVRDEPGDVPALQGDDGQPPRPEPRPELLQTHWSPAARLLSGATGGGLVFYGAARRGLPGAVLAMSGGALLTRAATNLPMSRLTGVGAGARAVDVRKAINVAAPVEQVWALWDGFENFPRFMTNVRDVLKHDEHSHWVVSGPAGTTVEWDAEITRRVPNQELAWSSTPGSAVAHTGVVRLEPTEGGTEVTVHLSYNPVAGAAGHAVATLLGANPKKQLDQDLLRMKTLVEVGKPPHDAAQRS